MIKTIWNLKPGLNVGRAALFQLLLSRTDAGDFSWTCNLQLTLPASVFCLAFPADSKEGPSPDARAAKY